MKIRVSDVLELHVDEHGDAAERALLIHGWMTTGGVFAPILDQLSDVATVFVPDLRGAGRSDAPGSYRLEDYAQDVIAILEHIGGASLVGFSMGGAIAQLVAAERPDLVTKMILLNSVPARGMQLPEEAQALFASSAGDRALQRTILSMATLKLDADACERLLDLAAAVDDTATKESLDAWTRGGFEERLTEVRAPTHVIATSDPFLPPAFVQDAVVDQIQGAQLHVIEGPGHYPMWEASEETGRLVARLLQDGA